MPWTGPASRSIATFAGTAHYATNLLISVYLGTDVPFAWSRYQGLTWLTCAASMLCTLSATSSLSRVEPSAALSVGRNCRITTYLSEICYHINRSLNLSPLPRKILRESHVIIFSMC